MTSLYKEYAQSLDTSVSALTFLILIWSEKAFIGPIFTIQKASPTNSNLSVQMELVLKGSEASKYVEIAPNFDLKHVKEHYIHTSDGNLSQVTKNPLVNRNTFM